MVLTVPLDGFLASIHALKLSESAWIWTSGGRTFVTSADPGRGFVLQTVTSRSASAVESELRQGGLNLLAGRWSDEASMNDLPTTSFWISAIAYHSAEDRPGLWMEAFPFAPTPSLALERLRDELIADGAPAGSSMEEFMQAARPNVLILDPDQQAIFAAEVYSELPAN